MRWNYDKLKSDIKADTQIIRELKSRQRESRQPRWANGPDDWNLLKAKRMATIHCSIAAHSNGRLHILAGEDAKDSKEKQDKLIKDYLREYQIFESPRGEVKELRAV